MTLLKAPNLYDYRDPVLFVIDTFDYRRKADEAFSVRRWAKEMGLSSPVQIADILNRKRSIKLKDVDALQLGLGLDPTQKLFFQLLLKLTAAQTQEDRMLFETLIAHHLPGADDHTLRTDNDDVFSHWSNMAILTLCRVPGFQVRVDTLAEVFEGRVDRTRIETAVALLLNEGLITIESDGCLRRTSTSVATHTDRPNLGAHSYFRQVADLSKEAISLPLDEREFQCFSFALSPRQMPIAKELVRSLRTRLSALTDETASQIYQANLQLFPLTDELKQPFRTSYSNSSSLPGSFGSRPSAR